MSYHITHGLEPTVLGWAIGALVAEFCVSVIPVARSALTIVFLLAGTGALAGAVCAAVARRPAGIRQAALASIPGAVVFACFLAAAAMVGWQS